MIEILVVEDDDADIFIIEKEISKASFESNLHITYNGEEALDFFKKHNSPRIDFIISDINMPLMNGHEFLMEIGKDSELKKIPVAMLTSSQNVNDYVESFQLNAISCIDKPLNSSKISTMIKAIESFWAKS